MLDPSFNNKKASTPPPPSLGKRGTIYEGVFGREGGNPFDIPGFGHSEREHPH